MAVNVIVFATTSMKDFESEPVLIESPPYDAVIECVPGVRVSVEKVAIPTVLSGALPIACAAVNECYESGWGTETRCS